MTRDEIIANLKRLYDSFEPQNAESWAYCAAEFLADLLAETGVLTGDDAVEPHLSLIGRDE